MLQIKKKIFLITVTLFCCHLFHPRTRVPISLGGIQTWPPQTSHMFAPVFFVWFFYYLALPQYRFISPHVPGGVVASLLVSESLPLSSSSSGYVLYLLPDCFFCLCLSCTCLNYLPALTLVMNPHYE